MTRTRAFLIHLFGSVMIVTIIALITIFIWYPGFYFYSNGAWRPLATIALVDAGLGPLVMFILFKPGKPGLASDVTILLILQVIAFLAGAWILYSQRPALAVYHNGLWVCLNPQQVVFAKANRDKFVREDEKVPIAYLPLPKNAAEAKARGQYLSTLPPEALTLPAYVFGEVFEPINKMTLSALLIEELDILAGLQRENTYQAAWEKFTRHIKNIEDYAYFSMGCGPEEYVVALDRQKGKIFDAFRMDTLNVPRKRKP